MRVIDTNILREKNKQQKQYEQSMWEKHAFIYIGVVQKVNDKTVDVRLIPSVSFDDYDMKKGFTKVNTTNPIVNCLRTENLLLEIDDIAVVIFTDLDSRQAIEEIRKGKNKNQNFNVENKKFHNLNFGIVINKIII